MLYLKIEDENLKQHCKNCSKSYDVKLDSTESSCVIDNNYVDDFHKQYLSPYIAYDPTLPRTSAIPCENKNCQRPENRPEEVIFVKYDSINMKFLYYCCHCARFFRTTNS